MSLALLFHYLLLIMFRMLVHPSSGACDLLWIYFMCCISLARCVLVLRCGSAGVVWYPYAGWSTKSTVIRKLLKMDVLTFETYWAVNSEIIKRVTSIGLSLFNYQDDARSNKFKIHLVMFYLVCFRCSHHPKPNEYTVPVFAWKDREKCVNIPMCFGPDMKQRAPEYKCELLLLQNFAKSRDL